ncbi:MAG: hypothetical protein KBC38_01430 [Candidatus Pacebacteria bacterium]|nr:hypothetical protein [Candidatus Paceibacterota bacterium]MBP9840297.1 hypothetical protein [Candidatus Paceibacterota bacterium]
MTALSHSAVRPSNPLTSLETPLTYVAASDDMVVVDDLIGKRRRFGNATVHAGVGFVRAFAGFIARNPTSGVIDFFKVGSDDFRPKRHDAKDLLPHLVAFDSMPLAGLEAAVAWHLSPGTLNRYHGFTAFIMNHRRELWAVRASCHFMKFAAVQECTLDAMPATDGFYSGPDCLLRFRPVRS